MSENKDKAPERIFIQPEKKGKFSYYSYNKLNDQSIKYIREDIVIKEIEALKIFTKHHFECTVHKGSICTCGLDELLSKHKQRRIAD